MASDQSFVNYVSEQMQGAGIITSRKMFGEYAIYCDEKVVGFVCDNQMFLTPTFGGLAILKSPTRAAPYPGAHMYYLLPDLDDPDWLAELVKVTASELPLPKVRIVKPRKPKGSKKVG